MFVLKFKISNLVLPFIYTKNNENFLSDRCACACMLAYVWLVLPTFSLTLKSVYHLKLLARTLVNKVVIIYWKVVLQTI